MLVILLSSCSTFGIVENKKVNIIYGDDYTAFQVDSIRVYFHHHPGILNSTKNLDSLFRKGILRGEWFFESLHSNNEEGMEFDISRLDTQETKLPLGHKLDIDWNEFATKGIYVYWLTVEDSSDYLKISTVLGMGYSTNQHVFELLLFKDKVKHLKHTGIFF